MGLGHSGVPGQCSEEMAQDFHLKEGSLVPEQNFMNKCDFAMFRVDLNWLFALTQCTPCKIPGAPLVIWLIFSFGTMVPGHLTSFFSQERTFLGLVPEHF
jgi:hypothetical protein